ncbi:histidine phosphatase family protein [Paenibacillus andongensis]|uniref:histidine phosphatase family protein n=1 Tax=Paenibacillus andongensis TaxID=2975482 RepID=UPI00346346B7
MIDVGDVSLTADGLKQAHATASHFKQMPISRIFSSPLNIAKQTAQIIGNATRIPIFEYIRLRERANWEKYQDKPFRNLLKCGIDAQRKEAFRLPSEIPQEELIINT